MRNTGFTLSTTAAWVLTFIACGFSAVASAQSDDITLLKGFAQRIPALPATPSAALMQYKPNAEKYTISPSADTLKLLADIQKAKTTIGERASAATLNTEAPGALSMAQMQAMAEKMKTASVQEQLAFAQQMQKQMLGNGGGFSVDEDEEKAVEAIDKEQPRIDADVKALRELKARGDKLIAEWRQTRSTQYKLSQELEQIGSVCSEQRRAEIMKTANGQLGLANERLRAASGLEKEWRALAPQLQKRAETTTALLVKVKNPSMRSKPQGIRYQSVGAYHQLIEDLALFTVEAAKWAAGSQAFLNSVVSAPVSADTQACEAQSRRQG